MALVGATGVQDDTAVLATLLLPHVVVVHALPLLPVAAVQVATPVGPVDTIGQVVVVQLLRAVAGIGTQPPDAVAAGLLVLQVVVV